MNKPFKPNGYNSLSPYFVINGAKKFADFMKELFNATELRCYDLPDGTILHMELQIDDSVIMIGDASNEFPANTHLLHLYVPNVDEVFEKAIRLGCTSMEPPKEREGDPDRRGTFKDYAGNIWSIGTQLNK